MPDRPLHRLVLAAAVVVGPAILAVWATAARSDDAGPAAFRNPAGVATTVSGGSALDPGHPFFRPLGANGRSCSSCHQPTDGWTITPANVQARFLASDGLDPIFQPQDGATCPTADVSTVEARRTAYRLLLGKGLVRVALRMPAGAELAVERVESPHGCDDARELSLYRRPLPTTNLRFLTTVMWDGRESAAGRPLEASLLAQAAAAALSHAGAAIPPAAPELRAIVAFELSLTTAQAVETAAGQLDGDGAVGGPQRLAALTADARRSTGYAPPRIDPAVEATAGALLAQVPRADPTATSYPDEEPRVLVNPAGELLVYVILSDWQPDRLARLAAAGLRVEVTDARRRVAQGWAPAAAIDALAGLPFVERVGAPGGRRAGYSIRSGPLDGAGFRLFARWLHLPADAPQARARESVARGEQIFNHRPIDITDVAGLTDRLGVPGLTGSCATCHNTQDAGSYADAGLMNMGLSDARRRTPDLPLFTLRCTTTGERLQTTDPGRALVTGRCADVGKVKVPVLRGLAGRPPYFHNGSAATLADVVAFYEERFRLGLTAMERADLLAFLRSL
jgi:cytochrome c peroxidase